MIIVMIIVIVMITFMTYLILSYTLLPHKIAFIIDENLSSKI